MVNTTLKKKFGETIRKARIAKNMTLTKAAEQLGVSPSYLSSLELNKEGQVPTDVMLKKISQLIGLKYPELRNLAVDITTDLRSMRKKISAEEAAHMQVLYRVIKDKAVPFTSVIKAVKNNLVS